MIDREGFAVIYENVPLISVHSSNTACWKILSPQWASGPPLAGNDSPRQPYAQSVSAHPSPLPISSPSPPTPVLAHTLWYALKFNQMLNYILTWVPTSWLYSPASD